MQSVKVLARRALWVLLLLVGVGCLAWLMLAPPDPAKILARIDVPPAPVLSPAEELATFRLAPGFRAELVASEPLVVDPVAMDWDDQGRLFVVEMRGFMPDVDGNGEDEPIGQVVVLEDHDADGRMDERHIFLDHLVLPRAIAVLPEGVLIGVPPDLILCRDIDDDLRCSSDERTRLLEYAAGSGNVEHRENALLPGIDGWIYNAKSNRRFRFTKDEIEVGPTLFRGQWGIAQDDEGRLFYNHNSAFLYADSFPGEYLLRQPATAASMTKRGINVALARDEQVFGVRVAPGLNRARQPGTLRRDGRQDAPTAVSGLVIQRGHQYGDHYGGDAFVPESAGSAVAHFSLEAPSAEAAAEEEEQDGEDLAFRAEHRLYPDDDYGEREFLASTDERFRPVDAKVGPDGAIWIIDMYRGVIQHAFYVSEHLREYVARHDLAPPGSTGRIWRIVREDQPIDYAPPPLDTIDRQIAGLGHPNGWVRDRAQRRIAYDRDASALPALRRLEGRSSAHQLHALWALAASGELDESSWQFALRSEDPGIRRTALRVAETRLPGSSQALRIDALRLLDDPDRGVRLQAIHTLGALPIDQRPLEILVDIALTTNALDRQGALTGLAGLEDQALDLTLGRAYQLKESEEEVPDPAAIRALATAAFLAGQEGGDPTQSRTALLDRITSLPGDRPGKGASALALALVEGIEFAFELPGTNRVVLEKPHPLFEVDSQTELGEAALRIRQGFTWPGDPSPGGARPLDADEEERRAEGALLYASTCAMCHGPEGRGSTGLAPPLIGSHWVRDADEWLVRIALQGLHGPIEVKGQIWNGSMPGHGHDPRFDDSGLAGLLTFLRRAWGHGDAPVSPEAVARIRLASAAHPQAWTSEELLMLPVEHRLDRFTGLYRIPIVGIELSIGRNGPLLTMGRASGPRGELTEIGKGLFTGEGMTIRFDASGTGPATSARVQFGSDSIEVSRVDP